MKALYIFSYFSGKSSYEDTRTWEVESSKSYKYSLDPRSQQCSGITKKKGQKLFQQEERFLVLKKI